jgi:CSLREA domain-containing protein
MSYLSRSALCALLLSSAVAQAQSGFVLESNAEGEARSNVVRSVASGNWQGTQSAASARVLRKSDLNQDSLQDVLLGFSSGDSHFVSIGIAQASAFALSIDAVRSGRLPNAFAAGGSVLAAPVAVDFLASGDFNADGRVDIAIARDSDDAYYISFGSKAGQGAFKRFVAPGRVDGLAAGRFDTKPGADLVLAISGRSTELVQLSGFDTGKIDISSRISLSARANGLRHERADIDAEADLLWLESGTVKLHHGGAAGLQAERVESVSLARDVMDVAVGNFLPDRDGRPELALLRAGGELIIASAGTLNTTPRSLQEVRALRAAQHRNEAPNLRWQRGSAWISAKRIAAQQTAGAARVSSLERFSRESSDDLLLIGDTESAVLSAFHDSSDRAAELSRIATVQGEGLRFAQTIETTLGRTSLLLQSDQGNPGLIVRAPSATFTVTKTADTNDGSCNADCSLREAISAANASAGADTVIVPAGTYTLTRTNTGGTNEDNNSTGDLDINGAIAITGAGAGVTIIQAGTTTSNGIDKVFSFNPLCTPGMTMFLGNVTVQFGRNTQPWGAADFSFTGGGIDVCNTGTANFTLSDVTVTQNSVTNGYGGGINFDSVQPATGSYSIIASTISNNATTSTASIDRQGGGINLFADAHNVSISNSTISGNTSAAQGGGINARHTNGGTITISGTTISGNTAAGRGGGISDLNLGTTSFAIIQDSVVSGNTNDARGGGIFIDNDSSTSHTINEVTITGNRASTSANGTFGGGIAVLNAFNVNATFNRIAGNFEGASTASGLHVASSTVGAANNWWGCNAGSGATPCDRSITTGAGTTTVTPFLVLNRSASPTSVAIGGTSTVSCNFLTNSTPAAVAVSNLDALIGTPISFGGAVLGSLSAAETSIQSTGTATATFTGSAAGAGSASCTVDAQTVSAAITVTAPSADLSITKSDGLTTILAGSPLTYTIAASNAGPSNASTVTVADTFPASLTCTWTCVGAGGTCTASGLGNINDTVNLPTGAAVTYTANCTLSGSATGTLSNTATVSSGAISDPTPANNSATDTTTIQSNTAPTISDVADQTINEDGNTGALAFTVSDAQTAAASLVVTTSSSNTTLIPNANVVLGGSGTNRTVTVTPVANAFGNSTITLTVSDGTSTASDSFVVTVAPIADTPSVTNSTTVEDTQTSSGLVITRNVADGAEVTHFQITNISNGSLFQNDGTTAIAANDFITVAQGGAGLRFTPAANFNGSASFNVRASTSNIVSGLGGGTATASISVSAVNDPPSFILGGNITLLNGTSAAQSTTQATSINDGDPEVAQALTFDVSNGNNALFSVQPAINASGTLTFTPTGLPGVATVSVSLTDDATAGGAAITTANQSFTITVGAPTITYTPAPLPGATQFQLIDGTIYFSSSGSGAGLTRPGQLSALPNFGANNNANVSCAISGTNASSFAFTSGAGLSFTGPTTTNQSLPLSCTTGASNQTATLTCQEAVNGGAAQARTWDVVCPTCLTSFTNQTIDATPPPSSPGIVTSVGTQTGRMSRFGTVSTCAAPKGYPGTFTTAGSRGYDLYRITPSNNPAGVCITARHSNSLTSFMAAYSVDAGGNGFDPANLDTRYLADPGSSAGSRAVAMQFTVPANGSVDLVVHDVNPGTPGTYDLTFDACTNQPPTISDVGNQTINEDANTGALTFTVGDDQTAVTALTVTATSSNTTLVPNANIALAGTGANRTVTVTPAANLSGTTTITLTVSNGTATTSDTFDVTVNPVNDTPSFTIGATISLANSTNTAQNPTAATAISDGDADFTQALTFNVVSNSNSALFTVQPTMTSAGVLNFTPTGFAGTAVLSITLTDDATAGGAAITTAAQQISIVILPAVTTTTIQSDTPDPSVVGQPYAVNVQVVGQSVSPLGTITIDDGTGATCGPVALVAGTAPNSTASCSLISTTAGNKTLTATYTPANTSFGGSSGTASHAVSAAATTLSLSGPATSRINQAISFSGTLAVTAPGAGTPAGTITLTSAGSNSCSYTLPATSCSLSWSTLGSKSITASFVSSNGDFTASSATAINTLVFAQADLAVSLSNQISTYLPDQNLIYTLQLENRGPDFAPGVRLQLPVPASLSKARWTCDGFGGAVCPAAGGVGNIDITPTTFPAGARLVYTLSGFVIQPAPMQISLTGSVSLPVDGTVVDPVLTNQSVTDTDFLDAVFRNGFEDQ